MDYRHRDYFLMVTDYENYAARHREYKMAAPSVKFHAPYNHMRWDGRFRNCAGDFVKGLPVSDGKYYMVTGMRYVQEMVSCRKTETASFLECVKKGYTIITPLTKDLCGH